jgi:hypothetical protein
VSNELRTLDDFARNDVAALQGALRTMGRTGSVPAHERDALFIAARPRSVSRAVELRLPPSTTR